MSLENFKHLISPKIAYSARDTWVSIEKLFLDNVTSRYMHLKSDFNEASKSTRLNEWLSSICEVHRWFSSSKWMFSFRGRHNNSNSAWFSRSILWCGHCIYMSILFIYSNSPFQITDLHVKIFNLFYPLKLLKPCILCVFLTSWFMDIIFQFIFCLFFMFYFICADSMPKSINESFSSNLDP